MAVSSWVATDSLSGAHAVSSGTAERVSVDGSGSQGDGRSDNAAVSADGRYVAFESQASNLVPGDTNGSSDVFVHDRQTGATERVSVDSSGNQGDSHSLNPSISADGRYVAFVSGATNLVSGDTNGTWDVFVHDRQTGATERVSVDSSGNQANGAGSQEAAISADGRYVAFDSYATNLVPGDTNHPGDVFVHDRQTGATELVSVDSSGNQGNGGGSYRPAISADGRYVAFDSYAADLVPGDTNGSNDVFVHDRQTGTTERVNVDSAGNQGDGGDSQGAAISADGRFVAFQSGATNLVPGDTNGNFDVFVHDRQTGATELVSVDSAGNQGGGHSYGAAISADGRYVAFESEASNLVPGDTNGSNDVFVHDRQTGVTELVSVGISGSLGDGASNNAAISTDGRYVAFESGATNLVPGDTNGNFDVFVRDRDATAATPTPTPPPVQTDLTQDAPAGATVLQPTDPSGFAARDEIVINPGGPDQEYSVVNSLGSLDLAAPLQFSHSAGEQIVRVATGIAPGDANCNRMITAQDAISVLRRVEGLAPYDHCVAAGNVVCTDGFTALDALDILLYVSNSSVSLPQGCPAFPVKLPETG